MMGGRKPPETPRVGFRCVLHRKYMAASANGSVQGSETTLFTVHHLYLADHTPDPKPLKTFVLDFQVLRLQSPKGAY